MGVISFHEFIGDSWCALFSHPADFTPVCTTWNWGNHGQTSARRWAKERGVKVLGLPASTAPRTTGAGSPTSTRPKRTTLNFPIIADKDRQVSMLFGMLDATHFRHGSSLGQTQTVRNVERIISPSKRVELILSYPAHVAAAASMILRVLGCALQLSTKYRVATPVNWRPGDDTVVLPFISDEEAGAHVCGPGRPPQSTLLPSLRARPVVAPRL